MDPWLVLQTAFGALQWAHGLRHRPITGSDQVYRAVVRYGGRELTVVRKYGRFQSVGGSTYWTWVSSLSVDVGSRPLRLALDPHFVGWQRIPTGDPAFDAQFRLSGGPADLLQSAFDPELRQAALRLSQLRPWIFGNADAFTLDITCVVEDGRGDPNLVREMADLLTLVTDRVCTAFDRRHAEIAATQGPGAAAAWLSNQQAAVRRVDERRRNLKIWLLVAVAAFVCLTMVGGIASLFI
jgi:hypothetical protein